MIRIAAVAATALLGLLTAASGLWGTLAVLYSGPENEVLRNALAAAVALVSMAALIGVAIRRWRWRALGVQAALFVVLLAWWRGIEPSNARDWQAEDRKSVV